MGGPLHMRNAEIFRVAFTSATATLGARYSG
jgi:hypothetical protein